MHCLLCLNGNYGEISRYNNLESPQLVICADGGANYAAALGITPDLVVGDMDSIAADLLQELVEQGIEVQTFPSQKDETDAQLALQAAVRRGADRITILGGIGDRLDHTWSTVMSLLPLVLQGIRVNIYHPEQSIYFVTDRLLLRGNPGDIVSLLALTPAQGVGTHELIYPLAEAELLPTRPYAVSNEMLSGEAEIIVRSGVLMVVHIPS